MHLDERSDEFWQLTNPGGMALSNPFPTRIPRQQSPPELNNGQGVIANGDGVIRAGASGEYASQRFLLKPFGTGGAGGTFSMNVYEWRATAGAFFGPLSQGQVRLWIPTLLANYAITLGNLVGVAGTDLNGSYNFAGTVTQSYGPTTYVSSAITHEGVLYSPGAANIAEIVLRILGARFVEVTFQLGTAAAANCLWAKL